MVGSSLVKCLSMCSYLSDFDPMLTLVNAGENKLKGRLTNSRAMVNIEIQPQPTLNGSYKYCVTTDSENFCFMVFND